MKFTNAWARATLLGAVSGTGVGALDRLAVVFERLCNRVESLPWLLLGLAGAAVLTLVGFVLYAAAAVVVGIIIFVLAEAAAILAGGIVAFWSLVGMASFLLSAYGWGLAASIAGKVLWGSLKWAMRVVYHIDAAAPSSGSRAAAVAVTDPYLTDAGDDEGSRTPRDHVVPADRDRDRDGGRAAIDRPWLASGSPRARTPESTAPAKKGLADTSAMPRAEVGDATLAEAFQSTLDQTSVSESNPALEAPDA